MFPTHPLFASGLLDTQNKNRETTINQRYSKQEIKYLRGEKSKQGLERNSGMSRQEFSKNLINDARKDKKKWSERNAKIGREVRKKIHELKSDPENYEKRKAAVTKKRIQTNMKRYGVRFVQSLPKTKKKQKETLIKNFGSLKNAYDIMISKSLESRLKKFGGINFCPMFSLASQDLFWQIHKKLLELGYIFNLHFATKNLNGNRTGEYQVLIKNGARKMRFLDFYAEELKAAIEFYEKSHYRNEQNILSDRVRINEIKQSIPDIDFFIVSEDSWKTAPDEVLNKCIEFLLSRL